MSRRTKVELKEHFFFKLQMMWTSDALNLSHKMVAFIFLISGLDLKYFNDFKEHRTEIPLNQKQELLRRKRPLGS